jgi:hypothetical protein
MSQMVDSKQQELGTDMIVQIASENTRSPYPFEKVFMFFVSELGMPNARLYKFGNTVFVIHPSEKRPEFGVFRALNADIAENFVQNGKMFVDKAIEDGFTGLQTTFSDLSLLNIFKYIGREEQELQNPNMGYTVQKSTDGKQIRVTLVLQGERMGA